MDQLCLVLVWVCSIIPLALAGTDCETPVTPEFGGVTVDMSGNPSTATYTCDQGYTIIGVVNRDCGDNQMWDGTDPKCMASLPDLMPQPSSTKDTIRIERRKLTDMVCALEEGCASSSAYDVPDNTTEWDEHKRILLRFSTASWNFGNSDFLSGTDPSQWEWHECHDHFHSMENFAHYDILNSTGDMAAEGHKASYCLADTICISGYRKLHRCTGTSGQGISIGCTDIYRHTTDCQWIDMTDVAPGNYTFQTHVNPLRIVQELSYDNNVLNCEIYFDGGDVEVSSCMLAGIHIGDDCTSTSNCTYPFSECGSNNTCGCEDGYRSFEVSDWVTVCTPDCDPDESFECQNGGTRSCPLCLECLTHAPYTCTCPYGYRGIYCELEYNPDDCDSYAARRYCKNRSTCVDGIANYTCDCTGTGYAGPRCTEEATTTLTPDYCLTNPCGPGFTCTNRDAGYSCSCDEGTLKGTLCLSNAPISGTGKFLPSLIVLLVISCLLH